LIKSKEKSFSMKIRSASLNELFRKIVPLGLMFYKKQQGQFPKSPGEGT